MKTRLAFLAAMTVAILRVESIPWDDLVEPVVLTVYVHELYVPIPEHWSWSTLLDQKTGTWSKRSRMDRPVEPGDIVSGDAGGSEVGR